MKIENLGYTISDVPEIGAIHILPGDDETPEVRIVIGDLGTLAYDELDNLYGALSEALRLAQVVRGSRGE